MKTAEHRFWSRKARAGTLAQIRARRDAMLEDGNFHHHAIMNFIHLFDDGAEFGPDKPEEDIFLEIARRARNEAFREVRDALVEASGASLYPVNPFNYFKPGGRFEITGEDADVTAEDQH